MELFKDIHTGCEADLFQPLQAYLRSKRLGRTTPPYIPQVSLMPVHRLCELALMWQEAGFEKEAAELAAWLIPLEAFPTLWCSEKEFDESAASYFFSLLKERHSALEKAPEFDVEVLNQGTLNAAFTMAGNGTSLGAIYNGDIEIRALGPQSESLKFGIQGKGMNGWTRCFAMPEVWMETKKSHTERQLSLDVRFVGLQPEESLSFAFYVKAQSCQIGNEILKPKSLRRFNGEANRIQLNHTVIESATSHKVQIIPLAGEGCYWDCEFLVSFEIHPFSPQANFSIKW